MIHIYGRQKPRRIPHQHRKVEVREVGTRTLRVYSLPRKFSQNLLWQNQLPRNIPTRASLVPSRSCSKAFCSSSWKPPCKFPNAVLRIFTAWSCATSSMTSDSSCLSSSSSSFVLSQSLNHERTAHTSFNVRSSVNQPSPTLLNSITALENHSLSRRLSCLGDSDDTAEVEST